MNERQQDLLKALEQRILVLDGAMGTALQAKHLSAKDFLPPWKVERTERQLEAEGCNELLNITRPDLISEIHEGYLHAGADIIEANTFGATPLVLAEYGLADHAREINLAGVRLAREIADRYSTADRRRFVCGSIGPTTKSLSVTGGITFRELQEHFRVQASALLEGGADFLLLETFQDTLNIKAALVAIDECFGSLGVEVPVAVSVTLQSPGQMLAGQSVEALIASLAHRKLLYLGINCSTGPEQMTDAVRTLARLSPFRVACVPNAGLPDADGHYCEGPAQVGGVVSRFMSQGWLNVVGGCCGTDARHIEELALASQRFKPRDVSGVRRGSWLSGIDALEVGEENRPVLVGERTNVIGSKKFKTLICEGRFAEAADLARLQIKNGAQVVDVCLANPDRNELEDIRSFLETGAAKIRAPLMIDSTDSQVAALALTYSQGKTIINSINLENGEERFSKILPLARQFGAAVVVGTIDDNPNEGMALTRERKLAVAERAYPLLTQKYGIGPEDIYWDTLVFPCGAGGGDAVQTAKYRKSAVETLEALRLIKKRFPGTKSVLGISNVSFGLPPAGREILNSVFLYHCVQAGLDLAIVNTEKLARYASIPANERTLAENLLFDRRADGGAEDPLTAFVNYFRAGASSKEQAAGSVSTAPGGPSGTMVDRREELPLPERLSLHIIEASRDGLVQDLEEALRTQSALEIINGPLMAGMDRVGQLFNHNELIVAEVLQSAEVMKVAVTHLQPQLKSGGSASRGKILLATVKGDVHDIGKNLVEIIFSNNGFEVIDLGIKVSSEQIITAAREHKPDLIGLSGLLVRSAQQMAVVAADLKQAGVQTPILVGGAALSAAFCERHVSPCYEGVVLHARDAMHGLELAKGLMEDRGSEKQKNRSIRETTREDRSNTSTNSGASPDSANLTQSDTSTDSLASFVPLASSVNHDRSKHVGILSIVPRVVTFERKVLKDILIEDVWNYLNPMRLYGSHLGLSKGVIGLLFAGKIDEARASDPRSVQVWQAVQEVMNSCTLQPAAVYQFFKASSTGNCVKLYDARGVVAASFDFPRQESANGLCLADYVHPDRRSGDTLATFVVSTGKGVREQAEELKKRGELLKSHILHALAIESAEALAEYVHALIRREWNLSNDETQRGRRFSFGYPACPALENQKLLFELLKPEELGITLTEEFMMDPEASVSAMVFHHPDAGYFSVKTRK